MLNVDFTFEGRCLCIACPCDLLMICLVLRFGVTTCVFFRLWSQVAIMAQGGFALLKQVAAAHLGNAAVQEQLCGAVRNLTWHRWRWGNSIQVC